MHGDAEPGNHAVELQAHRFAAELLYIGGVFSPAAVPTCTPTLLPVWTGKLAAGQTVRFAITPIIEEHYVGQG